MDNQASVIFSNSIGPEQVIGAEITGTETDPSMINHNATVLGFQVDESEDEG